MCTGSECPYASGLTFRKHIIIRTGLLTLKKLKTEMTKQIPISLNLSMKRISPDSKPEDIDNLVKNFYYGALKGYGVLLIMEGMGKTGKLCSIWFTLIDMDSKKVLTTARVGGKLGSGFGFRNYWASAIKNAIGHVKSKDYDVWKTGAGTK